MIEQQSAERCYKAALQAAVSMTAGGSEKDAAALFVKAWEEEIADILRRHAPPPTPPIPQNIVAARRAVDIACPNIERYPEEDDALRDYRAYRERESGEVRMLAARDIMGWGAPVAWALWVAG
jgi:hypothetical protein